VGLKVGRIEEPLWESDRRRFRWPNVDRITGSVS